MHHLNQNRKQPSSMKNLDSPSNQRAGATAVELAVVLPVLLLLAIACSDLSRAFRSRQVVCNATRCGAIFGASKQFTDETELQWRTQLETAIQRELQNLSDFQPDSADVSLNVQSDAQQSKRISVQTRYPFKTIFSWPGIADEIMIEHRVEFRQFR